MRNGGSILCLPPPIKYNYLNNKEFKLNKFTVFILSACLPAASALAADLIKDSYEIISSDAAYDKVDLTWNDAQKDNTSGFSYYYSALRLSVSPFTGTEPQYTLSGNDSINLKVNKTDAANWSS